MDCVGAGMKTIKVVTHRDPKFLKATYPHPQVELVNHEGFVGVEHFITFDGHYRLWKMTPERVPIPKGRFEYLNDAIFAGI